LGSRATRDDEPALAWVEQSVSELYVTARGGSRPTINIDTIAGRPATSRKPAVLTSPRSIKVCLEHGIDPAMLVPKSITEFAAPGLSQEHQRVKWQHHDAIRRERVDVLNEARDAMARSPQPASAMQVPGLAGATKRGMEGIYPGLGFDVSTAAVREEEAQRREVMLRRAEKQATAMELARERLEQRQAIMAEKVHRSAAFERERVRERAAQEHQRQRHVHERLQEKRGEADRRQKQTQRELDERFRENEDNRRRIEEQDKAERIGKQRAEKLRETKQAEFKQQTDAILRAQQAAILRKKDAMERKDAARQAFIEEDRTETAIWNERKRRDFDRRREDAKARGEIALEFRRSVIMDKVHRVHDRHVSRVEENEVRRLRTAEENAARSAHKSDVYSEAQAAHGQKIEGLLQRAQSEEHRVRLMVERRKEDAATRSLHKGLSLDERREKVDCMRRYKEYQNAQLLEKIARDTARAKSVLAAKEELKRERREANQVLTLQREKLRLKLEREVDRRAVRPGSSRPGWGGAGGRTGAPPRPRSAMI